MIYEEKKAAIISSIIEAEKTKTRDRNPYIFTKIEPLAQIDEHEILQIVEQFQESGKLKILVATFNLPMKVGFLEEVNKHTYHRVEVTDVDLPYFISELEKNTSYLKPSHETGSNEFFILFNADSDRRILLNGKIELSKPDFDSENERVFSYLYKNRNTVIKKSELKKYYEKTYAEKIIKTFDKILENLGFTKGMRSVFFDSTKDSIRFKSPVKL